MLRRVVLICLGVSAALLLITGAPAGAQQGPPQSPPSSPCAPGGPQPRPPAGQYPPQCASPQASASQVAAGGQLRVTGQCPTANSTADLRLSPTNTPLGSFPTNSQGFFDATVTIPATVTPGSYTIDFRCVGVLNAGFSRGPAVQVLAAAAQAARAGTLPRTGADPIRLAVSGVVLLGLGAGAVVATRRRRISA